MQHKQLKAEQAWKRLQLDQSRDKPIAFRANPEIDHQKIWMRRFMGNFQSFRDRRCRVPREFWRARKIDNRMGGARDFIRELARQKNRRLRNPKIRRPFFGFIHAMQQRSVLIWREVSVEY